MLYGHERADILFGHLFGRPAGAISDTDFVYFSTYLNRILHEQKEKIKNYRDHVKMNTKNRVYIYDSLNVKPRLQRMLASKAQRPTTAPPSFKRPAFR